MIALSDAGWVALSSTGAALFGTLGLIAKELIGLRRGVARVDNAVNHRQPGQLTLVATGDVIKSLVETLQESVDGVRREVGFVNSRIDRNEVQFGRHISKLSADHTRVAEAVNRAITVGLDRLDRQDGIIERANERLHNLAARLAENTRTGHTLETPTVGSDDAPAG